MSRQEVKARRRQVQARASSLQTTVIAPQLTGQLNSMCSGAEPELSLDSHLGKASEGLTGGQQGVKQERLLVVATPEAELVWVVSAVSARADLRLPRGSG